MDVWNLKGRKLSYLSKDQIEELHGATLEVLAKTGFVFHDERALRTFEEAGARVSRDRRLVRIPPDLIERAIKTAPKKVLLAARNNRYDIVLEGDRVYFGTGTVAINVIDLESGEHRPGTVQDCYDFPRLIDALEYIHFYKATICPRDVPAELADRYMIYGAFANTEKQVSSNVFSLEGARDAIRMAEVIVGGSRELAERPLICINVLASCPLVFAETNTQILIELAERGIPAIIGSEPQAGSTAPVTMAGACLLQNAEALAGITLAQLINPGTPVIMGAVGSISDMRTGGYASGAVELGIMNVVAAQMSQYYQIPLYATGGMSDSKLSDAQASLEKSLQLLQVALAGGNYIHDAAGLLDHCLVISHEQYVLDNEMCGMVARALQGVTFNEEALALKLINTVGPGGHFLDQAHTLRLFRDEHFIPRISDRLPREAWVQQGSKTAAERARERAKAILDEHWATPLPEHVDAELGQIIKNAESHYGGDR